MHGLSKDCTAHSAEINLRSQGATGAIRFIYNRGASPYLSSIIGPQIPTNPKMEIGVFNTPWLKIVCPQEKIAAWNLFTALLRLSSQTFR